MASHAHPSEEIKGPTGSHAENPLDSLRRLSVVVADTGDIHQLKELHPQDATTNPTLLLAACQMAEYRHLMDDAIAYGKQTKLEGENLIEAICDRLAVNFGLEILKIVPGVVSTEVDAALSFDQHGSIAKARKLIAMYEEVGIPKNRILIKMASTWEGIQAAKQLEKEGIHCNMTLLFSLCQAIAAADVGATLISPFVGRILDWHKAKYPGADLSGDKDPGVQSVKRIYHYYKKFGFGTVVMGASFRSVDEVLELAGCDKLTISPKLLKELKEREGQQVHRKLSAESATEDASIERLEIDEKVFRWLLNEDQMATEKLSDGIRAFHNDAVKLKQFVKQTLSQ